MGKSFLDRFSPSRVRSKTIDWPFAVDGAQAPKVRVSVLGEDLLEAASIETVEHFDRLVKAKKIKRKPATDDAAFVFYERCAQVFLAYDDPETGNRITGSIDDLAKEPREAITVLWATWAELQTDCVRPPMSEADFNGLVEELKKNSQAVPLAGLSSTTLEKLTRTLAGLLAASMQSRKRGS